MFENYLKIALRNLLRHKFYSAINILGLAIGLASFLIIGLWVKDELSYDKHFKNSERIYRLANDLVTSGESSPMAAAEPIIADQPKMILADEPTGNLDSKHGDEVMNLLMALNQKGTTIAMVTHAEHYANFCGRVIRLLDGTIVTDNLKTEAYV